MEIVSKYQWLPYWRGRDPEGSLSVFLDEPICGIEQMEYEWVWVPIGTKGFVDCMQIECQFMAIAQAKMVEFVDLGTCFTVFG